MNTTVMQAELELDSLLREHEALLDKAQGFGMRTAAFPRGLMPLRDAQDIVAKFDANTKKLKNFLDALATTTRHAPDKATQDALGEIEDRAAKALRKFEDDLKKAKEALAKHEDLLVGENFQEMFQALRLAVLDLDLTEQADFTAKTNLYLDANPAYAVGVVTISRANSEIYKVRATYKAETDEYVADMWSKKANRWFPAAKKTGHTRIAAFVKAVVDKMKAVHDFEGESLFESRRTVEDTSPEFVQYRGELNEQNRRSQVEKLWQKATEIILGISQEFDRKLRQRFPNERTNTYRVERAPVGVLTWNSVTIGGKTFQIRHAVEVNEYTGTIEPDINGFYGVSPDVFAHGVTGSTAKEYIDRAFTVFAEFVRPTAAAPKNTPSGLSNGDPASQLRAVLRAVRTNLKYPGTLGADVEAAFSKVLSGALPSITISINKNLPIAENLQLDVEAIQQLAHKMQALYRGDTIQVGDVTITQKVALKYRAQVVNLILTIPSKDARAPGPTNPNVSLAGSIAEYFARGSKGSLPAKVTSLIASIQLTVSRQNGRVARTNRTAGATTFEYVVWDSNAEEAFTNLREEERDTYGHREGYPGTIAAKSSYTVRNNKVMTLEEAQAFAERDIDRNDKWNINAFAVPLSKGTALHTDKVTVTITARDEKEALRQAKMRIYATGRFPPNADVSVTDLVAKKTAETARTKTFAVTGTRKAFLTGKIEGWLFYGWAPA